MINFSIEIKREKDDDLFLKNSCLCFPYSNKIISEDKNPKKNNKKDNSFNLVNKNSRNVYNGKIY